ncbi:MAG: bifunctional metallophosphatase/5'-nucleotidase [Alphaproteobacteria bacterium]|nr:MAG: bifunctional metallophosphatase/5'-nucleotidase [Alphaproteobacteria bacterium]
MSKACRGHSMAGLPRNMKSRFPQKQERQPTRSADNPEQRLDMKYLITAITGIIALISQSLATEIDSDNRRVSLAYINDVHAQLDPHPELFWSGRKEDYVRNAGGLSRIATVFKELRKQRPGEMLFLDGGDTIQGSGPAAWTEGKVVVDPMNSLGLDIAIPGNWAVTYGADAWKQRAGEFNYKMIAANMSDDAGKQLFDPYVIKEINGVRLGIIGFTEPDIPVRQPPFMSDGLKFQESEVLQPLVDELRNREKVDVVVVVSHIGLPRAVGLAESLKGVDIILSADTHERTYEPLVRGDTWIVEAGAFASFVGLLDITVSPENKIIDRSWRLIELRPELFPEDPEVKQIVETALAPHRERMNQVIGHTSVWLARYQVLNTSIDNVVADAIRQSTGADIALSNGYRFAPPTAPGAITEADLWTWLPINLELKTGMASGEQMRKYWENELQNVFSRNPDELFGGWLPRISGLTVEFNRNAEPDKRLRNLIVDDKPIDPEKMYSLAAGHRPGAPEDNVHRVAGCRLIRKSEITTHDAVRNHLKTNSPISSEGDPNVRCIDCPGIIRSQYLQEIGEKAP